MNETELKLEAPPSAIRAIDASLRGLGARNTSIDSRYHDTIDGRLAAARLSLRTRRTSGRWEQTVKAPGKHALDRLEETVPRPGLWGDEGPPVDPALHHGTPAGELLMAALRGADSAPTVPAYVHGSRVSRRSITLAANSARIEVAFDRGTIVAGDRSLPICEVEYELKDGDPRALIEFARAGIEAHGMWLSTLSKAARGDALAHRGGAFVATRARPPELRSSMSAAELRRAVLAACLDQVGANASVLAGGQVDDEVVHQLRVGLRRLRTAARELDGGDGQAGAEGALVCAFRALGDYRDRATVAASLRDELAAAGAPEPLPLWPATATATATVDPVALLRDAGFQHALLDVVEAVMAPASPAVANGALKRSRSQAAIAARLTLLHAELEKAAKRFARLDEDDRHRVRKRLKRLRYLAELVAPLYAKRRVERYLDRLRPAQDELGAYVDHVVATRLAREAVAAGDTPAWFNVGWLSAQMPLDVERCRRALREASTARPFWADR